MTVVLQHQWRMLYMGRWERSAASCKMSTDFPHDLWGEEKKHWNTGSLYIDRCHNWSLLSPSTFCLLSPNSLLINRWTAGSAWNNDVLIHIITNVNTGCPVKDQLLLYCPEDLEENILFLFNITDHQLIHTCYFIKYQVMQQNITPPFMKFYLF